MSGHILLQVAICFAFSLFRLTFLESGTRYFLSREKAVSFERREIRINVPEAMQRQQNKQIR